MTGTAQHCTVPYCTVPDSVASPGIMRSAPLITNPKKEIEIMSSVIILSKCYVKILKKKLFI